MSDFNKDYQEFQTRLAGSIKEHERIIKQLRTFLIQRKDIQEYIYRDLNEYYINTHVLLREIMAKDVNMDSINKYNGVVRDDHLTEEDYYDDTE